MKQELVESQAEGLTIKEIIHGTFGDMIITFTNDTFINFGVELGYDLGDVEIVVEQFKMRKWRDNGIDAGIFTKEELDKYDRKTEEERSLELEKRERRDYERLKKKFE